MTYLGIAVDEAIALSARLRRGATTCDAVDQLIQDGELLAGFSSYAAPLLDEVRHESIRIAAEIDQAVGILNGFTLRLSDLVHWGRITSPAPARTPVPEDPGAVEPGSAASTPPRWNAVPPSPWNDVHQDASHNSYAVPGGVEALFDMGIRSFELDIHRGPPTSLLSGNLFGPSSTSNEVGVSHAGLIDWRVYHASADPGSEYESLSEGLEAIASLEASEPLTVFVDNKDAFDGAHSSEQFDVVLRSVLGDRLYGPSDLAARAPAATSLHEALAVAGWPTVSELEGRVMVVLTDNVASYDHVNPVAFVAASPRIVDGPGGVQHVVEPDRVRYNANARRFHDSEILAVQSSGSTLRTYFNPLCPMSAIGEPLILPNFRAVDIEPDSGTCGPAAHPPPVDTVVADVGSG